VHDLFFADCPELYPPVQRLQLHLRVPRALRTARRVIVPSEFTKAEVLTRYGIDDRKIRVIPLAASDGFRRLPPSALVPARERYRLPEQFILFVGALQPRKNLARLIAAFGTLCGETRRRCPLVIAGPPGWMVGDVQAAAAPLVNEGSVRTLGYVPDEDVPPLMNLATIFAFPSLSEGFGLPVVEAQRCGTCVLAGDAGSLPEVVADAGLLVDPLDVGAIAAGLETLLANRELRVELAERGKRRASRYSWNRTAQATAAVYHEVLAEGAPTNARNAGTGACPA
jgi:alpha-1,3-rhamnosyl/mannosyltransferase